MLTAITHVTVLVDDTDEALRWYTEVLGFEARSDEEFGPGMRFVTVAPPGETTEIVLQEPTVAGFGEEVADGMRSQIGKNTMTVLATDDCRATVAELEDRDVTVTTQPEEVPWGIHAIIEDIYGNPYNIVEEH